MADWDADRPRLRVNLEQVSQDLYQWVIQRDRFTASVIKRWHRKTMAGLDVPHPNRVARFRGETGLKLEPVFVGSREGTKAERVAEEVDAFVSRLQAVFARLDTLLPPASELDRDGLQAVIELAAWAHSEWVRIHPFCNGNGRSARMLANAILMRYGLPPVLQLRPRPPSPCAYAGARGMDGDASPMESLLRRLLRDYPNQD